MLHIKRSIASKYRNENTGNKKEMLPQIRNAVTNFNKALQIKKKKCSKRKMLLRI